MSTASQTAGSTSATAAEARRTSPFRGMDMGRLVGIPLMSGLLVLNALSLVDQARDDRSWASRGAGVLVATLSVAFYSLLIAAFARRSPAKATNSSRPAAVAAFVATWIPFSLPLLPHGRPGIGLMVMSSILLVVGLAFSVWSIRFLDRSFSLMAQARAVVRQGPYRYVRHPLYTGELVALAGTVLARPSWWTALVWVSILGLQAYRAHHEEAVLSATLPEYGEYQKSTPRLIPSVLRRR